MKRFYVEVNPKKRQKHWLKEWMWIPQEEESETESDDEGQKGSSCTIE